MKKTFKIVLMFLIVSLILFTSFTIKYKSYSQEELEEIYYNCEGSASHYFLNKDSFSFGVRCFDIDTAKSSIYGDCERIMEYEENLKPFFKRLYKCSNPLEIRLTEERSKDG